MRRLHSRIARVGVVSGSAALLLVGGSAAAPAGAAGGVHKVARATGSTTSTTLPATDPWGWPGTKARGYLPPHEPALRKGKVMVGLITAGTPHDGGYYQSEVTALDSAAKKHHWKTIVDGPIPTSGTTGLNDAENMCKQGVDLLLIGETQLVKASYAAESPVCKDTLVWIYGSDGSFIDTARLSSYLAVSETTENPQSFATGVAMGLWLQAHHQTRAGFITGPNYPFTERPAQAYEAGMTYVFKNATLDAVFTGTFTQSGPAITAATTMLHDGIELIVPYLGSSLLPTSKFIASSGGATLSAGGKWCSHDGVTFAIEQAFNPGYQLAPALTAFAHGKLRAGHAVQAVLGENSVPTVAFCPGSGVGKAGVAKLKTVIKKLAEGSLTAAKLITASPPPK